MLLQLMLLLPVVLHHQRHHSLDMFSKPVPTLSAYGTQPLEVGPGHGGTTGLDLILHQHVDQLVVEGLVTAHDQVAQADDGMLPDCQPGTLQLWRQNINQFWMKLYQEPSKPGEQISQDVQSFQLNSDIFLLGDC